MRHGRARAAPGRKLVLVSGDRWRGRRSAGPATGPGAAASQGGATPQPCPDVTIGMARGTNGPRPRRSGGRTWSKSRPIVWAPYASTSCRVCAQPCIAPSPRTQWSHWAESRTGLNEIRDTREVHTLALIPRLLGEGRHAEAAGTREEVQMLELTASSEPRVMTNAEADLTGFGTQGPRPPAGKRGRPWHQWCNSEWQWRNSGRYNEFRFS